MLIIIEGVDRTGKTSLARRVAEKIGGTVIHAGVPTRHPIEEYETTLDGYDPRGADHLILDRWHLGEYVWPTIFNRETLFTEAVQTHTQMFMRSRGAFVIYAVRDPSRLREELVAHNEPLHPDDLDKARELFLLALSDVGAYGTWDYSRDGDAEIDTFIDIARGYAEDVARVWNHVGPGWVGSEVPRVLLVGDELGPEKPGREAPNDVPFAPYTTTSGRYLIDSLVGWGNYALVNALQGRNQVPRDLRNVWRAFQAPRVVALGGAASEALAEYDVPHNRVPHPQYQRRFHYNNREEYTKMIQEAAR